MHVPNCTINSKSHFYAFSELGSCKLIFFLFPGCDEINNIQIHFKDVSQKKKKCLATVFDRFLLWLIPLLSFNDFKDIKRETTKLGMVNK